MLTQILNVGNKIELKLVATKSKEYEEYDGEDDKIYYSQIYDIIDEEHLRVTMPIEGSKLIPLPINTRYDVCFYTNQGLYTCRVLAVDRYKENNFAILVIEVLSDLQKYQRRQYYRLGCTMDIKYKKIDEEETAYLKIHTNRDEYKIDDSFNEGIALDLSGGGIRFVSDYKHEKNDMLLLSIEISYNNKHKEYLLLGKIVESEKVRNKIGVYEHRVEFSSIDSLVREALIRFIFEEERKQRKKDK